MSPPARPVAPADIVAAWPRELTDLPLAVAGRIDSTQAFARRCVERLLDEAEVPPPFVVAALEQSAGRGRRGRAWQSAPGLGVWCTLVVETSAERLPTIPMRAAVGLAEVCGELGAPVRLKWPNDLVVGGRKLGGLLVDVVARGEHGPCVLVGFGIDCYHDAEELPEPRATSLALAGAEVPPLDLLLPRFVGSVWRRLREEGDWLERYVALSAHAEGDELGCSLGDERVEGRFAGFDERGFLRLSTAAGERVLSSGDVFSW